MRVLVLALLLTTVPAFADNKRPERPPLGTKVDGFALPQTGAKANWSLAEEGRDAKAVVVVFIGTECPVSNAFLPTLARLSKEYASKGVVFVGVNSNAHDNADAVARHAKEHSVPFPVLMDADAALANRFKAERAATAFLLDASRTVRYRGRINDQFERGLKRAEPTKNELRDALDAVLAGKEVAHPFTEVIACPINRADKEVAKQKGPVTYNKQVVQILQKNCQECHRPGEVGPFQLMNYKDAVAWSDAIREVVSERIMPPWTADPKHGKFANDRRLSDEDREMVLAWVDGGCPEGDPDHLPPARKFVDGWNIGTPDEVIEMNEKVAIPAQAPKGGIPYKYVLAGKPFDADRWVRAAEVRPGNRGVVHHIIVYVVRPGQKVPMSSGGLGELLTFLDNNAAKNQPDQLLAFVPGDQAFVLREGMAKRVPKGSQLVFELHYTPNGKAGVDQSVVGLKYADSPPKIEVKGHAVLDFRFAIPPKAANHPVSNSHHFDRDVMLVSMNPHMHLRGKAFEYRLIYPDKTEQVLLSVPKYDFNWQFTYTLAEPKRVPKGAKLVCTAHYDNSPGNPYNPDPSKTVRWGDQTWEEMMIGFFEYYDADPADRKEK